jgi:hypothetical protein
MPRASIRRRAAPARRGGSSWQAAGIVTAGLPARGHRAVKALVRAGVHRARQPPDAPWRRQRTPLASGPCSRPATLALTLGERFADIRFLLRDRGPNFTASFDAVFQAAGTTIVRTAVRAPRMNATCERLAGTLRRELLDRVLILGEGHLRAALAEYQVHYNTALPHQGIAQRVPGRRTRRGPHHHYRPRQRTDPPKTRPGRPDQRIRARRLTPRRTAGHQADPIFERDRIRTVLCSVRTPRMNAIAERWIGGCRRELLDRTLIWNHSHLRRIPGQYENTTTSTGRTAPARHGAAPRR